LYLRRTSRQRRIPMRDVAAELIENREIHLVEAMRHAV
jgi:AmiR/NasT family two-component response regulator